MTLRITDKWIWDFWIVTDNDDYHIFYLQAPKSLDNPEKRHWHVSIGHAVSTDLLKWIILPDALSPSTVPAWDDFTTWTGCTMAHGNTWYLFYTGTSHSEKGLVQRIGLATSTDLVSWKKHTENPVIEADSTWYELLDSKAWYEQAWRDPWVFKYKNSFHAYITGRINNGQYDQRGVIAHAKSDDLIHWNVLAPIVFPGDFGHMEVPQVAHIGERYYLIFSCHASHLSISGRNRYGNVTGIYYLYSDTPFGPYPSRGSDLLFGDEIGSFYSGRLIQGKDLQWYLITFSNNTKESTFIGEISDPMPVEISPDGKLKIK